MNQHIYILYSDILQEIPPSLLDEYKSAKDQKLMIQLITRNEFIYKTSNPTAADNPYDSVLKYDKMMVGMMVGAELPMMQKPSLPDHLCCSICKELCMRAVRLNCCNSQVF